MIPITSTPDELQHRLQHLKDGLRHAGGKLTHQRLEICREIAMASNHPDAETIYRGVSERVPTMALDTIYRTLSLLVEAGLIEKFGTFQESMRFDGNTTPHHHFICTRCGEAHDFYSDAFDQLPVPEEVHTLGHVQRVRVEVRGICQRCGERSTS
ncbi:MAG: Fur family transcriptional regulator [Armatimonadota bacterium]